MKLLTLDLESTSDDVDTAGVHQIAGEVYIQGEGTKEVFNYYARPFPTDTLKQSALDVCGKTYEQIMAYPPPHEAYNGLMDTFKTYIDPFNPKDKFFIVGYGVSFFDHKLLRSWFTRCNGEFFNSYVHRHCIDIYHHAFRWCMQVYPDMPNMKLGTVYQMAFGEPLVDAHDAVPDWKAARRLAQFLLPELYV